MIKLSKYEQETIVNYNAGDKIASVYTADPVYMRKLDKLVEKNPDTYKVVSEDKYSKTYEMPKKLIAFRSPIILSEKQKEQCRKNIQAINDAKNK